MGNQLSKQHIQSIADALRSSAIDHAMDALNASGMMKEIEPTFLLAHINFAPRLVGIIPGDVINWNGDRFEATSNATIENNNVKVGIKPLGKGLCDKCNIYRINQDGSKTKCEAQDLRPGDKAEYHDLVNNVFRLIKVKSKPYQCDGKWGVDAITEVYEEGVPMVEPQIRRRWWDYKSDAPVIISESESGSSGN